MCSTNTRREREITLLEVAETVPGFEGWPHKEKIKLFAWHLHVHRGREHFMPADIRCCYDELRLDKPANINSYIAQLRASRPREILRDSRGYALERRVQEQLTTKYGEPTPTVQVRKLLQNLPERIPNLAERDYLNEALVCFRHGAFRAAIVMCWNLVFDHLCNHILTHELVAFNRTLPTICRRARITSIGVRDDFSDIRESEILEVCKSARIISKSVHKILKEKLDRRNMAAHPSNVTITQIQAEDFITDVVNNAVLKLL